MVVLINGSGNHSNRLFQSIHFEAYCKKNNKKFITLCFEDMKLLYGIKKNIFAKLLKFLIRALRKIRIVSFLNFDEIDKMSLLEKKLKYNKLSIVEGWNFRCHDLTEEYREYFKEKYLLNPVYYLNNAFVANSLKKEFNEIIVGIHIRRGDYKTWNDGKYFFADEIYKKYMDRMIEILDSEGCSTRFIIFSNEKITFTEMV